MRNLSLYKVTIRRNGTKHIHFVVYNKPFAETIELNVLIKIKKNVEYFNLLACELKILNSVCSYDIKEISSVKFELLDCKEI